MNPLQSLAVLLILVLSLSDTFAVRIIGGHEVTPYSRKFQASLQFPQRGKVRHYCGGTLVHPMWVVSAAHCWKPSKQITVVLCEHNLYKDEGFEQVFNVSKIFLHNYNHKTFNNDIMLLKLSRPAQLNKCVQPVTLPDQYTPPLRTDVCTVSGWGVTALQLLPLTCAACRGCENNALLPLLLLLEDDLFKHVVCWITIRWKGFLSGRLGGPLICNGHFEGIVSWGISCANPYFPGVYTKVRNYVKWIDWYIAKYP